MHMDTTIATGIRERVDALGWNDLTAQLDARGFAVTANNRLAPDDYPYPLSGTWSSGHRARRIRECLEARPNWSAEDCRRLQQDVRSGRAAACVPKLVALLAGVVGWCTWRTLLWPVSRPYHTA